RNLHTLDLGFAFVTDDSLKHLVVSKSLQALFVGHNHRITDKGLKEIGKLHNLRTLDLSSTPITVHGMEQLSGLKNLERLYLNGAQISDFGLKHLHGLNNLHTLWLDGPQFSKKGLADLKILPNLQILSLSSSTLVTDKWLKELAGFEKLQTVNLSYTN